MQVKDNMNILILTTYFPPDTAVAAVRPYMFAKYLCQAGHNVTLVRSGKLWKEPDSSLPYKEYGFAVHTVLGDNSPAARYEAGKYNPKEHSQNEQLTGNRATRMMKGMPFFWRRVLQLRWHVLNFFDILIGGEKRFRQIKRMIDRELSDSGFDIVFATFGDVENIYGGQYAARKFNCRLIIDFRDAVTQIYRSGMNYLLRQSIQRKAVISADACTAVSEGLRKKLNRISNTPIYTLYNGFDDSQCGEAYVATRAGNTKELTLCYTGTIYGNLQDFSPLFLALNELSISGKLDLDKIRFIYAGSEFPELQNQAETYGMQRILCNRGYVGRAEVSDLLNESDLFIVASWNTENEQGVLTGKFYEGIRAQMPILSLVSGDKMGSELEYLTSEYKIGFCYEKANHSASFPLLCSYLLEQYRLKMQGEVVSYNPVSEVFEKFRYDNLTKSLIGIMQNVIVHEEKP